MIIPIITTLAGLYVLIILKALADYFIDSGKRSNIVKAIFLPLLLPIWLFKYIKNKFINDLKEIL